MESAVSIEMRNRINSSNYTQMNRERFESICKEFMHGNSVVVHQSKSRRKTSLKTCYLTLSTTTKI